MKTKLLLYLQQVNWLAKKVHRQIQGARPGNIGSLWKYQITLETHSCEKKPKEKGVKMSPYKKSQVPPNPFHYFHPIKQVRVDSNDPAAATTTTTTYTCTAW